MNSSNFAVMQMALVKDSGSQANKDTEFGKHFSKREGVNKRGKLIGGGKRKIRTQYIHMCHCDGEFMGFEENKDLVDYASILKVKT